MSSQTIKINYHLGFDCKTEINGEQVRGGCSKFERMEFAFNKKENYFESNKLELVREIRNYSDGKFGKNLEKDSLTVIRSRKTISLNDFNDLVSYIEFIHSKKDNNEDSIKVIEKIFLSKWDRNTFNLNRRELRNIENFAKATQFKKDSVIPRIVNYIKKENMGFKVSSVVEWLKISFELNGINYSLFQNNLGGVNVSWDLHIDKKVLHFISPELNEMIASFLPNNMKAKNRIKEIFEIKELKKAFLEPM